MLARCRPHGSWADAEVEGHVLALGAFSHQSQHLQLARRCSADMQEIVDRHGDGFRVAEVRSVVLAGQLAEGRPRQVLCQVCTQLERDQAVLAAVQDERGDVDRRQQVAEVVLADRAQKICRRLGRRRDSLIGRQPSHPLWVRFWDKDVGEGARP